MTGQLKFGGRKFNPTIIMLSDMKNIVLDLEWLSTAENFPVYYFYRGLYLNDIDKSIMLNHNIRYDITIIHPYSLGVEMPKTRGHYHPIVSGTNITYPEMYQVLSGKACFLMQREENGEIVDVIMVHASEGDIVISPPNYGHIIINDSRKTLKTCNWMCNNLTSIYDPIDRRAGGAYYKLVDGKIIQNINYEKVPILRFIRSIDKKQFGIKKNIYELIKNPQILDFIVKPQRNMNMFKFVEQ